VCLVRHTTVYPHAQHELVALGVAVYLVRQRGGAQELVRLAGLRPVHVHLVSEPLERAVGESRWREPLERIVKREERGPVHVHLATRVADGVSVVATEWSARSGVR
jgi:hypothetical protein